MQQISTYLNNYLFFNGLVWSFIFLQLSVLSVNVGFSQNYDPVVKAFSRAEYEKGKKLLIKILDKKNNDPGALFFMGQYFFDPFCPENNLDSAYSYAQKASLFFQQLKPEEAKRIEVNSVNGHEITLLKHRIELKAFQIADSTATEAAYQSFVDKFPNSEQASTAVLKRDKIGFEAAQKANTYQSFAQFLDKYPKSIYAQEAHEKYENLLFHTLTASKTLEQYRNFVQNYPASPYIEDAVAAIYQLTTHTNSPEDLLEIARSYPQTTYAHKALYRLAYIKPSELVRFQSYPQYAQLVAILKSDTLKIIGFWADNGKLGFIDTNAEVVIEPQFESLHLDYICKGTSDKFIVTQKGKMYALHNKLGKKISEYEFESVESEQFGQVVVSKNQLYGLYHLGGFWSIPCQYQSLEVISKSAVLFGKDGKYGLLTHTGELLLEADFDEIDFEEGSFILHKEGKCNFLSEIHLFKDYQPNKPISINLEYQNCKRRWSYVSVQSSSGYQVIHPKTKKAIIKNARQCLATPQGWLVKVIDRWTLHQPDGKMIGKRGYDSLVLGEGLIAVKFMDKWGLTDSLLNEVIDYQYDSIILTAHKAAILIKGKERFAYYKGYKPLSIPEFTSLKIRAFGDSASMVFLIAVLKNGKAGLWNMANSRLLPPVYDEIYFTPLPTVFIVRNGNNRGLISQTGKWILPIGFQGLVYMQRGWFATYRGGLFGLCNPEQQIVVQPQFSIQPRLYHDSLFMVKKQKFAFFDGRKNFGNFEDFDQVEYWNDTSALVQHQNKWKIYDFRNARFDAEYFDKYEVLFSSTDEIVLKTFRSSGFGILSNRRGRIVAEEFTGIKQLGTQTWPLFLAEKHIPQAGIFVLLYYGKNGQILRRQVINDPNFENYTCTD